MTVWFRAKMFEFWAPCRVGRNNPGFAFLDTVLLRIGEVTQFGRNIFLSLENWESNIAP
jgi:hypothetical protein